MTDFAGGTKKQMIKMKYALRIQQIFIMYDFRKFVLKAPRRI